MTDPYPFFEQLLFGDGFWLGLLLILAIIFFVSYKVRYVGGLFAIALIFIAIEYNNALSASSNRMWAMVICFVAVIFLITMVVAQISNRKG